ncbi:MAG: FAD-binding and (Fe-S)-binding domain-containing protein [Vicinamibacterales bacterium]
MSISRLVSTGPRPKTETQPREPLRSALKADALESDLRAATEGEVRFGAGDRALHAPDASNSRQVPIGIVVPRSVDDVVDAIGVCHRHGAPILARGAGTSIAGQCCNVAVVIDASKHLNRVLDIDAAAGKARVQPGLVLDDMKDAANKHGWTFGPDPGTHRWCTLGGMLGNNSCGVHSVLSEFYGPGPTTAHHVETLDVITYRGVRMRLGATTDDEYRRIASEGGPRADIYRRLKSFQERYADAIRREFPDVPRRISGYNLPALLPENGFHIGRAIVGSESTLVYVLEASLQLVRHFPESVLVVLGYRDIFDAADAVPAILEHRPMGLEGVDEMLIRSGRHSGVHAENLRLLPDGHGWLYVEFAGGTVEEARERADVLVSQLRESRLAPNIKVYDSREQQHKLWQIREAGGPAVPTVGHEPAMRAGWDDSAVAPEKLGAYLRDLHRLYETYHYTADLFGHFGQGCVHCRVSFELDTAEGVAKFRSFMQDAADLVHRYGGSLSGEHGDGQARGELLSRMFSPEIVQAFREFKSILDPDWKMNPGKVIDANPLDQNLRLWPGLGARNSGLEHSHFHYGEDHGSFAQATLRCVGIGKCRKHDEATMCPSYMVTREEKHTTRGRAHLLYEMLRGEQIKEGWASEEVHEALDLCLSCKGCKGECPVQVDMATYKAEFLSHYYEHHRRPRAAYTFGLIHTWAKLASCAPRLVNFVTQTPGLRGVAKFVAGMPPQRRIPAFAPFTFREWFVHRERTGAPGGGDRVILWPDTFTNHFHPETAIAAVGILEDSGFAVEIPRAHLCCGRPLYDYGMLDMAKQRLRDIISALYREIDEGIPIVGLEPSCIAVFRDELKNLFPDDARARRLSTLVWSLGEFLSTHADRLPPMTLPCKAIVHGHCHQKALFGMDGERRVLDRLDLDYIVADSGCCGMAGSFGFEHDHYDVSQAIGERRLLPQVRNAGADTLIVADGFSCREQIAQSTDRVAMHLADVLAVARRHTAGESAATIERAHVRDYSGDRLSLSRIAAVALVVVGAAMATRGMRQPQRRTPR